MRITTEQMQRFEHDAERRYIDRLTAHLNEYLPVTMASFCEDARCAVVARAAERAELHGLIDGGPIARFAYLFLVFGPDFDALPWAAASFQRADLTPVDRLERVYDHIDRLARAARDLPAPASGQSGSYLERALLRAATQASSSDERASSGQSAP